MVARIYRDARGRRWTVTTAEDGWTLALAEGAGRVRGYAMEEATLTTALGLVPEWGGSSNGTRGVSEPSSVAT